ncbi:hypothetical protein [Wenjunlia tyrosinilytica]|uniref:Uncharacterized protein n=1 Tax=Wenjunlia tyrosinilytica TaxID=1544741 RepID=A0A917ZUQ9_9ACTN|nr:hypothetical protein [Wenjunlia tyrosinilytica]GGO95100.1 hypothetical protein GCM10012280_51540 [Wenjunlia tyrosinilytica]
MSLMSDAEWRQVPVRLDAERWTTRAGCRQVLVVVHSVVTGQRLLDVVRLLEGDLRVQVIFAMVPDVFSNGVPEFLDQLRAVVMPWRQAVQTPFDLAFAAGHEGIHELHAPVVVLPHGVGHNKFITDGRPGRTVAERAVYGLSHQWLIRDGAVVPETIVLSHREDLARLGRHCPEALPAAEVVGDACYDRILASRPLRALYRAALDTGSRRELVLVTTTWGPRSLLGRTPELLDRLVAELPRDRYRIAMMIHPNAWNAHGEWQIQAWLAELRRSGLALVSQQSQWCGVLVAADHIIGDHGSMTLYGAATGVPVLLASYPETDVDPGSPMAELASFAPRVDSGRSLLKQLTRSAEEYRPADLDRVAARLTSEPGRFSRNMRALMYRKLRLRAPAVSSVTEPARLPVLLSENEQGSPVP